VFSQKLFISVSPLHQRQGHRVDYYQLLFYWVVIIFIQIKMHSLHIRTDLMAHKEQYQIQKGTQRNRQWIAIAWLSMAPSISTGEQDQFIAFHLSYGPPICATLLWHTCPKKELLCNTLQFLKHHLIMIMMMVRRKTMTLSIKLATT